MLTAQCAGLLLPDAVERVVRRDSVPTRRSKRETEGEEDEEQAAIDTHSDTTQELDTAHAADEDVEMGDETTVVKPKPKKRRVKKVIPVGRNGLKKKEIMKTRMVTDENGYLGLYLAFPTRHERQLKACICQSRKITLSGSQWTRKRKPKLPKPRKVKAEARPLPPS